MSDPHVDWDEEPPASELEWFYGTLQDGTLKGFVASSNGAAPHRSASWLWRDLADLEDVPPVQPTLGGVGLVYPGMRHVFSGPQESAKTLAAYAIALQVVRAGDRVALVDFEMGQWDTRTRLRELGASQEEIRAFAYLEPESAPSSVDTDAIIQELEPALVVVDASAGAFAVSGMDDNRRAEVELWHRSWIDPFRRAGIATLVLDHVVKSAEARGAYAIGSERKVGGADVHIGFHTVNPVKRGADGLYRVTTHKDRGGFLRRGHCFDFTVSSHPDSHALTCAFVPVSETQDGKQRPTVYMERISRWLEMQWEGKSRNEIEENVEGGGRYIRWALDVLRSEGWTTEHEGPRRALIVTSQRPYRQDQDSLRPTSSHFVSEDGPPDFVTSSHPVGRDEVDEVVEGEGRGRTSSQENLDF